MLLMINQVKGLIDGKDLIELGELEEQIVTGLDQSRKDPIGKTKLQNTIGAWLTSTVLTQHDKLRLILLAKLYLDISQEDLTTLMQNVDPSFKTVLNNLDNLLQPDSTQNKDKYYPRFRPADIQAAKQNKGFTRHTPYIHLAATYMLEQLNDPTKKNNKNSLLQVDYLYINLGIYNNILSIFVLFYFFTINILLIWFGHSGGILLGLPLGLGGSCSFFIQAWLAYLILTKKIAAKILSISFLCLFSLCLGIYLSGRVKIRFIYSHEMSGFMSLHQKLM